MTTLEERLNALGDVLDDHYGPIALHELATLSTVLPPDEDEEMLRLKQRLGKASKILQDKRARIH